MGMTCDIIIPVYNALDELKECIDSLIRNTNLNENRVIIVNDCSPDNGIDEYLSTINDCNNIIVYHNDTNLGFVGTVNVGMKKSNNDVLLLNSDTVVTPGWLEKIKRVAYSDDTIGSVTPLTNNGTICSVPEFLQDNEIPAGYTIDSFSRFIEVTSFNLSPEIPTAVGFCMFIKRKAIDEIGYFDEIAFGKGYGEENDFCCRLIEFGYRNVLADNTFIYHKGSMSFQGEKLKLMQKNLAVLTNRYPYYERMIQDFIHSGSLNKIHDNIKLRLPHYYNISNCTGNILYVVHNFFDEEFNHPIGGTEFHLQDLVNQLSTYNSYVLVSNKKQLVLKHYLSGTLIEKYCFQLAREITHNTIRHQEYANIIEEIIKAFNIQLVHIHHLINHTLDVPYIAKKYDIKVLYTLHDFHLLGSKMDFAKTVSEYNSQQENTGEYGYNGGYGPFWRNKVKDLMLHVDLFITPSKFVEKTFLNQFPEIKDKIIVIEHGLNTTSKEVMNNEYARDSSTFNIAFIGGLSPVKGSEMIHDIITRFPLKDVAFHLIGRIGDQNLNLLEQNNLYKTGPYNRDELYDYLKGIDLVCILSNVPETYSYTLSEAWVSRVPVIVTPVGALKERVEEYEGGWIAPSTDFKDVMNTLVDIIKLNRNNTSLWNSYVEKVSQMKLKTLNEMGMEYSTLYLSYISKISFSDVVVNNDLMNRAIRYYMPVNNENPDYYDNQIEELRMELKLIKSSIGWKLLEYLRNNNRLILSIGKKLIYLGLRIKRWIRK